MRVWYQSYHSAAHGAYWARLREHLMAVAAPGTEIDIHGVDPDDSYPHALEEWRAGREMICNAIRAERAGYDAVVVGHFQDSGLYEAKAAVDIPVIGLGETSMLHACRLGQRIGLVSFEPRYTPWFEQQIARYGLQQRVSVHVIKIDWALYDAAVSAETSRPFYEQFAAGVRPLVAAGCDVLVPTGGGAMLKLAHIGPIDGAPVVDGTVLLLKMAEIDVMLRQRFGVGASRVGAFKQPPREIVDKFLENPKGL